MVAIIQLVALPLAEGGRAHPKVHHNVEDGSAGAADELRHPRLKVHPPDDASGGARVVVLDPFQIGSEGAQLAPAIGLEEEPPLVSVDGGLEQQGPLESRVKPPHRANASDDRWALAP